MVKTRNTTEIPDILGNNNNNNDNVVSYVVLNIDRYIVS